MVDGQKSVQLPIYIISDDIPEFNESFSVEILPDTIKGGAVVSNKRECMVIILENDYPYGLIGTTCFSSIFVDQLICLLVRNMHFLLTWFRGRKILICVKNASSCSQYLFPWSCICMFLQMNIKFQLTSTLII